MARKQSIIVRCDGDGCKEIGEVVDLAETPCGWYRVYPVGEKLKVESSSVFDFHSLRCVEKWAKARRDALESSRSVVVGLNVDPDIIAANTRANGHSPKGDAVQEAALLLLEEQEEFTSRELQEFTGIPQNTVDFNLRKMISEGRLTYRKMAVQRGSGTSFPTRVYRAVPATSTP